jgi:hypothetical protein
MAEIIYQGAPGSLPHQFQYSPNQDNPLVIQFSGSCYSGTPNRMVGLQLTIGNEVIGTSQIYSNGNQTHRATVPTSIVYKFNYGTPVTITVSAATGDTVFDINDFITILSLGASDE